MRALYIPLVALALGAPGRGAPDGSSLPFEVLALRDVRVPAEVAGRVLQRPESEHASVKKREVVVALDDVLLRARTRAARAAAQRARARHDWSELELTRVRALFAKETIGKADLDRAEIAGRETEADLAAAVASLEEAEARLRRAQIRAPFSGKLVRVYPQKGEYVRVGETAFRIVDDSRLKIVTYVPASWLGRMRVGAELRAEPEQPGTDRSVLHAKVFSVAPAAEGRARTFRVEARAEDSSGRWRPGMTGRFRAPGSGPGRAKR